MSKSVRTVRFDKADLIKIEEFLKQNSFLDFSSLARISINNFIENPSVQIKPIQSKSKKRGQSNVTA
jgi:hypothetical protein